MRRRRHPTPSWVSIPGFLLIISFICSSSIPGILSLRTVTLQAIEIFSTHEWLAAKPVIYFYCQGENKTVVPDVKEKLFAYTFKGEESWQPLTELPDKKCKRCGLYERDSIKSDDVFDEWEFCPDDFVDGKYARFKEKEFNATFVCSECTASVGSAQSGSDSGMKDKKMNLVLVIVISSSVAVIAFIGIVGSYKYWQKRKREKDQARFLKLFEDADDIEDELGLGT